MNSTTGIGGPRSGEEDRFVIDQGHKELTVRDTRTTLAIVNPTEARLVLFVANGLARTLAQLETQIAAQRPSAPAAAAPPARAAAQPAGRRASRSSR